MMRKAFVLAMVAGLIGMGGFVRDARAGATVDLFFVAINGAPIPATRTVDADVGDVLTMAIMMTNDQALTVSFYSLNYDVDGDDELDVLSQIQWPGVPIAKSVDFFAPLVGFSPTTATFVGSFQGATTNTFGPRTLPPAGGAFAGGYQMGTVTWKVNAGVNNDGADILSGIFNRGVDAFGDAMFNLIDGQDGSTNLILYRGATVNFLSGGGGGAPAVSATKSDAQLIDADGDGDVDAGDTLRYTVVIANAGNADAQTVVFSDTPDPNAPLIDGTVATTQGTVTAGNGAGDASVGGDIGTIPPGASVTVTFDVAVVDPLPAGVESVSNQGLVSGTVPADLGTDDPGTPAAGDATVTNLETGLEACQEDAAICESDLGACESDLGTCRSDLATAQDDLAACLNDPPFEDADGDGEHDATDACPGTPPGGPVDQAGCSLAQFCAGFDPSGTSRNSPCNQADWGNDEPLGAEDCKARSGVCQPR